MAFTRTVSLFANIARRGEKVDNNGRDPWTDDGDRKKTRKSTYSPRLENSNTPFPCESNDATLFFQQQQNSHCAQ